MIQYIKDKYYNKRREKMDIVFIKPKKFEEIINYMEYINNEIILHLNVTDLDKEVSQRVVDFISGAAYAKDAQVLTLGNGVFCILPHSKEFKIEYKSAYSGSIIDTRDNEEEEIRPSR